MPCSFGYLSYPRSETGAQPNGLLEVTVTVCCIGAHGGPAHNQLLGDVGALVAYHRPGDVPYWQVMAAALAFFYRSMVNALWLAPLSWVTIGPEDRVAANSARSGLRPRG